MTVHETQLATSVDIVLVRNKFVLSRICSSILLLAAKPFICACQLTLYGSMVLIPFHVFVPLFENILKVTATMEHGSNFHRLHSTPDYLAMAGGAPRYWFLSRSHLHDVRSRRRSAHHKPPCAMPRKTFIMPFALLNP